MKLVHIHNRLAALRAGLTRTGKPVPEATFTHSHSQERRRICTDNKHHWMEDHPLYGAISQRELLDPIKLAYTKVGRMAGSN